MPHPQNPLGLTLDNLLIEHHIVDLQIYNEGSLQEDYFDIRDIQILLVNRRFGICSTDLDVSLRFVIPFCSQLIVANIMELDFDCTRGTYDSHIYSTHFIAAELLTVSRARPF
jgi:hypothetical protein